MNRRCYIAGAGEFDENVQPGNGDFIIAADGGYVSLASIGVTPDLIVGDFDSIPSGLMGAVLGHPGVMRTPSEKDDTDMMLAVNQGLERGFKEFIINGGLGGRLDHTLANVQTLTYLAQKGARGVLTGREISITAIKDSKIMLSPDKKINSTVSVFSAGDKAEGVTLKGLKYPLSNATVTKEFPIGVSNETIGQVADISVEKGTLIITYDGRHISIC